MRPSAEDEDCALTARNRSDLDRAGPLAAAVTALREGAIVAYPTDTLYGLAVDPRREAAVARLIALKGRLAGTGFPLIAADLTQVESCLGRLPVLGRRLADNFWPGPLTLVVTPDQRLPAGVAAADGSLAVRVPRAAVARRLARACGHPITATSANRAGVIPAATGAEVTRALGDEVSIVMESPRTLTGAPSTIVDARDACPVLLRAGAVPWERVLQSLA